MIMYIFFKHEYDECAFLKDINIEEIKSFILWLIIKLYFSLFMSIILISTIANFYFG